jgi:hypothetical protein
MAAKTATAQSIQKAGRQLVVAVGLSISPYSTPAAPIVVYGSIVIVNFTAVMPATAGPNLGLPCCAHVVLAENAHP